MAVGTVMVAKPSAGHVLPLWANISVLAEKSWQPTAKVVRVLGLAHCVSWKKLAGVDVSESNSRAEPSAHRPQAASFPILRQNDPSKDVLENSENDR